MPEYVIELVSGALNRDHKSINGSKILLLGMAYKPDIDDVRESPALDVYSLLKAKGAKVAFNDPYVDQIMFDGKMEQSVKLTDESLASYDCVVITTNHSAYDIVNIVEHSKLIVDTRNACKGISNNRIMRLGAAG